MPETSSTQAAPLSSVRARAVASAWIDAFNRHDLDAIMAQYAGDVELQSPVVARLLGEASGLVRGREALRAYFAKGLALRPDLYFELLDVFAGVRDVAVYYRGINDQHIVETMTLDDDGRIARVRVTHRAHAG